MAVAGELDNKQVYSFRSTEPGRGGIARIEGVQAALASLVLEGFSEEVTSEGPERKLALGTAAVKMLKKERSRGPNPSAHHG